MNENEKQKLMQKLSDSPVWSKRETGDFADVIGRVIDAIGDVFVNPDFIACDIEIKASWSAAVMALDCDIVKKTDDDYA
jgi:hypothetical protein